MATITEATVRRVLYFPEQLPDAAVHDIAAHSEVAAPLLELRQFSPVFLRLSEVAVDRRDTVDMRFRVDNVTLSTLAGSMFTQIANNFSLLAKERLYYNLYNSSGAPEDDFKTRFTLWVIKPTVAHKLLFNKSYPGRGIPLTPDEQKLNRDLGIAATVEKGLLPLPLAEQITREYQILQEETHAFQIAVPTEGVDVETLHPQPGQFLILTQLSASQGADVVDNIRIAVDRDYVTDYVEFPTWPFGPDPLDIPTALGREINCFIPAMSELRIKLKATVAATINIRFTVRKVALSNLLRARFGLVSRDEIPGDTFDKVMAGVL